MKHIFVINPQAGKKNAFDDIMQRIQLLDSSIQTEFYVTSAPGDATRFVQQRCAQSDSEIMRFYACGGDGTLNEVVSGLIQHPETQLSCVPVGSGNDYIKYYGSRDRFLDLNQLINGDVHTVDIMKITSPCLEEPRYSLNITNFGFDAVVCKNAIRLRRTPIIGGDNSYTTGILMAFFNGWRTTCHITVDDILLHDGPMLLCTLGNGRYNGGAYQCSPLSINDDGLIEVCLFKPMSLFSFAKLISSYRDGSFIHRDDIQHRFTYCRASTIDIQSPKPLSLCIDGEILTGKQFSIRQLSHTVNFVTPTSPTDAS